MCTNATFKIIDGKARFIIIDRDTGKVLLDGKDGRGYETAKKAYNAYKAIHGKLN